MLWILVAILVADAPWLEIPFVEQSGSRCGAASIAMVMQYWNAHQPGADSRASDERVIYEALPAIRGKELRATRCAAISNSTTSTRTCSMASLMICVVICRKGGRWWCAWRRARNVVRCISRWRRSRRGRDLLNDPARGKLFRQTVGEFEREWGATGRWALLAVPREMGLETTVAEVAPRRSIAFETCACGDFEKARQAFVEGARENPRDARFARSSRGSRIGFTTFEARRSG